MGACLMIDRVRAPIEGSPAAREDHLRFSRRPRRRMLRGWALPEQGCDRESTGGGRTGAIERVRWAMRNNTQHSTTSARRMRLAALSAIEALEGRTLLIAGDPDLRFGAGGLTELRVPGYQVSAFGAVRNGNTVVGGLINTTDGSD